MPNSVNIDDNLRRRGVQILSQEQDELDGAFDRQTDENAPKSREQKRIIKNSDGTWEETTEIVKQKFYDESVVGDKESKFKEDAEVLQKICREYDLALLKLNDSINEKKLQIKSLSDEALSAGCTSFSRGIGEGIGTTQPITWNNDATRIKIYPKMAGPDVDYDTDNVFDPDKVIDLTKPYCGFGYKNLKDQATLLNKTGSGTTVSTGSTTDGSGTPIGEVVFISQTAADHTAIGVDANYCVGIGNQIRSIYDEISDLRKERDSYLKDINNIKSVKSEKELMNWGYQNTKTESKRRKNKNKSAIDSINRLDSGEDVGDSRLVLYFDASDNSSYYGSGNIWYDISTDAYDDNATFTYFSSGISTEPNFYQGNFTSLENHFIFVGSGNQQYADFTISNPPFGDPSVVTVELLAQLTIDASYSDSDGYMLFGWDQYSIWTGKKSVNYPPALGFHSNNGDLYGIPGDRVEDLKINKDTGLSQIEDVLPGQWAHYVFEMNVNDYTKNKIYINGDSEQLQQITDTRYVNNVGFTTSNLNFNLGSGRIAGWRFASNSFCPIEIAVVRVYNTALSQQDVQNNYQELASRFGI